MAHLPITYDENLIEEIRSKFYLRQPNVEAIATVVKRMESGDFDPLEDLTLNLATGVGKTYVMAGLIEYLRRQGMPHVMIVTPSKVVQDKTVQDFQIGSPRYIEGFDVPPRVVTPDDVHNPRGDASFETANSETTPSTVYIFNVQQLFPPKEDGKIAKSGSQEEGRRKTWKHQESTGVLGEQLAALPNLVVMVDEAHLFGKTAEVYRSALTALKPAATVGLTASPSPEDNVIYHYPLWRAINEGYVKQPVLVFRRSGYPSEDRQLQDALSLLRIKESAYAAYREANPGVRPTKPILFVVCSNVEHATNTVEQLVKPGFVGDPRAVLQVDNEHDDPVTQRRLRDLDLPGSDVRVVVSVNKLREGWDTKRISVMCTLRALASDVLTQQVMGRGLRLPFGEITGVPEVDELDIISHKSFESLLADENILKEFGIEDAVPEGTDVHELVKATEGVGGNTVVPTTEGEVTTTETDPVTETGGSTVVPDFPSATPQPGQVVRHVPQGGTEPEEKPAAGVGIRQLGDDATIPEVKMEPVVVSINPGFEGTTFTFPSSVIIQTEAPFNLYDISTEEVRRQAERVTDTMEHLNRSRIEVDDQGHEITTQRVDRVAVPSFQQTGQQVTNELVQRVMSTGLVVATSQNIANLHSRIVPEFMAASRITEWTEKAKESAATLLRDLVVTESRKAAESTKPVTKVQPVRLPVDDSFALPFDKQVLERLRVVDVGASRAGTGFKANEFYGPWTKGLFEAAKFDSFSAEYMLAELFNFDPDVVWWKRLYPHEQAIVYYTPRSRYLPDFVVKDTDGVHWIIEGKSERGKDDETVQLKKRAAERVIRELIGHPDFDGQRWGYLIAYESDVKTAESFADLKRLSATEVMPG